MANEMRWTPRRGVNLPPVETHAGILTGDMLFLSLPPKDVFFSSLEEMVRWYERHPERVSVVKNIGAPQ